MIHLPSLFKQSPAVILRMRDVYLGLDKMRDDVKEMLGGVNVRMFESERDVPVRSFDERVRGFSPAIHLKDSEVFFTHGRLIAHTATVCMVKTNTVKFNPQWGVSLVLDVHYTIDSDTNIFGEYCYYQFTLYKNHTLPRP